LCGIVPISCQQQILKGHGARAMAVIKRVSPILR